MKTSTKAVKSLMSQFWQPNDTPHVVLGSNRYVYTKTYRGVAYLDVREFYTRNEKLRFTPIRVMMTLDEWLELRSFFPDIRRIMVSLLSTLCFENYSQGSNDAFAQFFGRRKAKYVRIEERRAAESRFVEIGKFTKTCFNERAKFIRLTTYQMKLIMDYADKIDAMWPSGVSLDFENFDLAPTSPRSRSRSPRNDRRNPLTLRHLQS